MNQELLWQASMLEKQTQEIEQHSSFLQQEINDLSKFKENIGSMPGNAEESEILASLGKGVYVKASMTDKKLFVDVGAGVIVKKSSADTEKIIDAQLKKLSEAKLQLQDKLESYQMELSRIVIELEKSAQKK